MKEKRQNPSPYEPGGMGDESGTSENVGESEYTHSSVDCAINIFQNSDQNCWNNDWDLCQWPVPQSWVDLATYSLASFSPGPANSCNSASLRVPTRPAKKDSFESTGGRFCFFLFAKEMGEKETRLSWRDLFVTKALWACLFQLLTIPYFNQRQYVLWPSPRSSILQIHLFLINLGYSLILVSGRQKQRVPGPQFLHTANSSLHLEPLIASCSGF